MSQLVVQMKTQGIGTRGRLLCLYGIRAPIMEAIYHAITTHRKALNAPSRGHFSCLEVCCYGIDLGTSIVMFNQSDPSISTDLDQ